MVSRKNKTTKAKSKSRRRKSIKTRKIRGGLHELKHAYNYFNKSINSHLRNDIHMAEQKIFKSAKEKRFDATRNKNGKYISKLDYTGLEDCFQDTFHLSLDKVQDLLKDENISLNELKESLEPFIEETYREQYKKVVAKQNQEERVTLNSYDEKFQKSECENILNGVLVIAKMVRPKLTVNLEPALNLEPEVKPELKNKAGYMSPLSFGKSTIEKLSRMVQR